MHIQLTAGTNVGLVRKNNEDNFVVNINLEFDDWTVPETPEYIELGKYGALLVVADGMGGLNAGEVASQIAVNTMQQLFTEENLRKIVLNDSNSKDKSISRFLANAVKTANANIIKTSNEDGSAQGMGTTIVIAWLIEDKAHVAWCGDSRCYVFNESSYTRISKDHSYVQELVDSGELNPEYAFDHPYSNIITRCLGDDSGKASPDYRCYKLKHNDIILLCTDGLSGLCRDDEIMDIVTGAYDNLNICKESLINAALAAGGHDNVTVALCHIIDNNSCVPGEDDSNNSDTSQLNDTLAYCNRRRNSLLSFIFGKNKHE